MMTADLTSRTKSEHVSEQGFPTGGFSVIFSRAVTSQVSPRRDA
jgi:hypothetical protein